LTGRRDRPPRGDRLIALFLLALVLFNPPLLRVFGAPGSLFGWPGLLLYIFGAWIAVIALMALVVERDPSDGHSSGSHSSEEEEQ
jgi:hypothetical protein